MNEHRSIKIFILLIITALIIYSCGESGNDSQSLGY